MKVFIDVGSHRGQTLKEVSKCYYHFDVIHCFEPMLNEYEYLLKRFKSHKSKAKIIYHNNGLLDVTKEAVMYGSNKDMGATIFKNKVVDGQNIRTVCKFQRASEFFKENIDKNDIVIMKINVEGSECIIMNDLLDTKECLKIDNVMIDFDIRRVPDKKNDEYLLKERLIREGYNNYSFCDDVMKGLTHQKRIRSWLSGLDFARDFMDLTTYQRIKRSLLNLFKIKK